MGQVNEPVRWDAGGERFNRIWGLPPQRSWVEEASPFEGITVNEPTDESTPLTLEQYLQAKH